MCMYTGNSKTGLTNAISLVQIGFFKFIFFLKELFKNIFNSLLCFQTISRTDFNLTHQYQVLPFKET